MMPGVLLILVALILLRFLFTCPAGVQSRLGPTGRNLFFYSQHVLYWGVLITGLVFTFLSSVRIGLVALGCFLVLYNASVSDMKWKGIPLLGNSLILLIGIVMLFTGIVLSFIISRKLGLLAIAGSVVAVVIMNILMAIERSVIKKQLTE